MLRISKKILFPELSYKLVGICFKIHRKLGRFYKEQQYANAIESALKENQISYKRESKIGEMTGNRVDFLVENKIILDTKAKGFITKEDYNQMQRYLQSADMELGLIVNFRNTYLKPKRILNTKRYSDNSDADSDNSDRYYL